MIGFIAGVGMNSEITHDTLMERARKVPRLMQNPATLREKIGDAGKMEMPLTQDFYD